MIALRSGEWTAEVRPEIGGVIASLCRSGVDVLRPMPPGAGDPLQSACFPLVPYCNRIGGGRFRWAGREVLLPPNFPPETHSLHGLGWQRAWTVESSAGNTCVLVDAYDGHGPWPWAYRAQQRIRLGPAGCAVTLILANVSGEPMPAGMGLHPYFRRQSETELCFEAGHVLLSGADPLPDQTIDHCFAGWRGQAMLRDSQGAISLSAEGAPLFHIYAPADGSALCLEPVTHAPDALNRAPAEMILLPPGCAASLTMRISAG